MSGQATYVDKGLVDIKTVRSDSVIFAADGEKQYSVYAKIADVKGHITISAYNLSGTLLASIKKQFKDLVNLQQLIEFTYDAALSVKAEDNTSTDDMIKLKVKPGSTLEDVCSIEVSMSGHFGNDLSGLAGPARCTVNGGAGHLDAIINVDCSYTGM
jgi:hypothetical protein